MDNVAPTSQQFTSPLSCILLKISKYQPNLHLTPNEFSYLAAMAMWGMEELGVELNSDYYFVQSGYDETTCHSIIRYVDERINEDPNTSDVRVNNFLKRALEQGLLSLAGMSVADVGGTYRLTQLAHDLLKPFQQSDELDDKETLSQRYLRIDQELSSLNAASDGEKITDSEWLVKVDLFLPSLKDLLTGVFKNQEFLISKFQLESFAREFVEKALSDNKPVSNVSVIRNILSKFPFNETDRFRLAQCTIKELMKQSDNIQDDISSEWVLMDESANYEIEEQWLISQGDLND
jgi:hypothetical protein